MLNSTPKDFQNVYEGEIWCLCTMTFGQKVPKLNSSLVYHLRLYGGSNLSENWVVYDLQSSQTWTELIIVTDNCQIRMLYWNIQKNLNTKDRQSSKLFTNSKKYVCSNHLIITLLNFMFRNTHVHIVWLLTCAQMQAFFAFYSLKYIKTF